MMRGLRAITWLAVVAGWVLPAPAQPIPAEAGGPADRPTRYGIRFTPGMARSLAGSYARMLTARYELDPSKVDQTTEAVARRFMALAHRLDDEGIGESLEGMLEGILAGQLDAGNQEGLSPKSGRAMAEGLKPVMPAFRELVRGVAQDVRPMLAAKQQIKFGADLLAFNTAMDAFEQNLDRWSRGEVRPFENPFEPGGKPKLDESGRSPALNAAERRARQEIEQGPTIEWKKYVEDAKKFYNLDAGQAAAADSILNESLQQAAQYVQDEQWRIRAMRIRLWKNMLYQVQVGAIHPVRYYLTRQYDETLDAVNVIEQNLKRQIDQIPTQAQRRAAEDVILAALGEQGFVAQADEGGESVSPGPAEKPAAAPVQPPPRVWDEKGSANEEPAGADAEP